MGTKSNQLRGALRAYVEYRRDIESDTKYETHMRQLVDLESRYGRERVKALYRRYRGAVTILIKDGITYRRL
jgi:hypothetical protein